MPATMLVRIDIEAESLGVESMPPPVLPALLPERVLAQIVRIPEPA